MERRVGVEEDCGSVAFRVCTGPSDLRLLRQDSPVEQMEASHAWLSFDRHATRTRSAPMKVMLIDDHPLFRAGLRHALAGAPEFQVVGEWGRARDAFQAVDAQQPDIVVMDVALPGMDGIVATREVLRRAPHSRVLILTVYDQLSDVLDAMAAGVSGYALKTDDASAFLTALRALARGEKYIAPKVAERLSIHQNRREVPQDILGVLSTREREVFRLAAECLLTREIARELCISRKTVDTHLYRIHRKLGLRTSAELVRLASSLGMVHAGRTRDVSAIRASIETEAPEAAQC
jgi:DNA-binding NarL/FixJ family response regulator